MKAVLIAVCIMALAGAASTANAQASPPAKESVTIGGKSITIAYSSPRVRGREGQIFGKDGLIGHDSTYPVWRAGANSATVLQTDGNLVIGGLTVPSGDYTLYVNLADPEKWELVINKQTGQWGLAYNQAQDLGRVPMTMSKPPAMVEELKYTLSAGSGNQGTLTLEWENHRASVSLTVE